MDSSNSIKINKAQILEIMPQQPPFLFLDEAVLTDKSATGSYKITGKEDFLKGHFKGNPIMPASIMMEALGQLGVLFLIAGNADNKPIKSNPNTIFLSSADNVRCVRFCRPGDVLTFEIKNLKLRLPIAYFTGKVKVGEENAVLVEKINLTFDTLK